MASVPENISMTRIVDLPDTGGMGVTSGGDMGSLASDMYIPMNVHPNPYGIAQPPPGGMLPPQHTQKPNQQNMMQQMQQMQQNYPAYPGGNGNGSGAPSLQNSYYANDLDNIQQRLPQRDIPMDIAQHTQDIEIQPNYIPKPKVTADYIREYQETTDKKIRDYENSKKMEKRTESLFDEIQMPILVVLIYFIFQLPIINTLVFKKFAFLSIYKEDGNFNLTGLLLKSILFGGLYYGLQKSILFVSTLE
jgi:hypothetical protein